MGRILYSDLPREVAHLEVVERGVTPSPQPPNHLAESWYPDHLPHTRLKGASLSRSLAWSWSLEKVKKSTPVTSECHNRCTEPLISFNHVFG